MNPTSKRDAATTMDAISAEPKGKGLPPAKTYFDLGGRVFVVTSTSLLPHQKTMLYHLAVKEGHESSMDHPIFIARDAERFRYVMDFMNAGQVFLPVTESKQAFLMDMDYYGFDMAPVVEDGALHVGTLVEVEKIAKCLPENTTIEVEEIEHEMAETTKAHEATIKSYDAKMTELGQKKYSIKTAEHLFHRFLRREESGQEGKKITLRLNYDAHQNALKSLFEDPMYDYLSMVAKTILEDILHDTYGLVIEEVTFDVKKKYDYTRPDQTTWSDFTLRRSAKRRKVAEEC